MNALPAAIEEHDYDALRDDPSRWMPTLSDIALRHGLDVSALSPAALGANLIAMNGRAVVKVFPPFLRFQWESERLALPFFHDRLTVPTPALLHEGEHHGWPYVVITQLEGTPLETLWPSLTEASRCALLQQIGVLMAEAHQLDAAPLAQLEPHWDAFFAQQRANCHARHAQRELPGNLLDQLEPYLARADAALNTLLQSRRPCALTGEYTPMNLLAVPDGKSFRLSGMFDFGDVMVGPAEYDMGGPCVFLCAGDATRFAAFLQGYGRVADAQLTQTLMALLLLHRFSDLRVQVRIDDWQRRVESLEALAALLFPLPYS